MRKLIFQVVLFLGCSVTMAQNSSNILWYKQPAKAWIEALPLGNGRLGAMVYGDPVNEVIQINEESIWAGCKVNNNNPNALIHLGELRQALFSNQYSEALKIAKENFVGIPPEVRSYQPFGNLLIHYQWKSAPTGYRRQLDLATGITTSEFQVEGKRYLQKTWISAPDNLMVVRIESANGGLINSSFILKRGRDASIQASSSGIIKLNGQIQDAENTRKGPAGSHMKFSGELRIKAENGTVSATDSSLVVSNANGITLVFTAATDYNIEMLDFDRSIDPESTCKIILDKVSALSSRVLEQRHLKEYQPFFERVKLSFGTDPKISLPTDERLKLVKEGGADNGLMALYFQYGRYLLMGSSRKPGVLPANLQGIWSEKFEAPWNADFHTNINLQMNYWLAENCNLSEMSEPLNHFMTKLMVPGSATATEMYGTKGWTLHHLTDPFGRTGVADGVWGITPMNGPWMTFPVYEHFLFTRDTTYLREVAYPLLKGSAEFVLGYLSKSPEGYLVTNPSHSPENTFLDPATKTESQLTYAATVDIEITNALFDYCTEAAGILNTDREFVQKLKAAQKQFPPVKINSKGCIQEWVRDFEETEPGHRHMSHLLGLYPLFQFTPENPALFKAANASLERRLSMGGGHTGWSRAWIINFYARLQNGEKAYENAMKLLSKSTEVNLFDTHPPFQIDGNFGGSAGIVEMLLQSHNGIIRLLPALPEAWPQGEVTGLCARGGFVINMKWEKHKLIQATVYSKRGGQSELVYNSKKEIIKLKPGQTLKLKL